MIVTLSNFSSVLEISFALNALLYIYDVLPARREQLKELQARFDQAQERGRDAGLSEGNIYYPMGFVMGSLYRGQKLSLTPTSTIGSLMSLCLLLWASFLPQQQLNSWLMAVFLFMLLLPIPLFAWYLSRNNDQFISEYERIIDGKIMKSKHLQ